MEQSVFIGPFHLIFLCLQHGPITSSIVITGCQLVSQLLFQNSNNVFRAVPSAARGIKRLRLHSIGGKEKSVLATTRLGPAGISNFLFVINPRRHHLCPDISKKGCPLREVGTNVIALDVTQHTISTDVPPSSGTPSCPAQRGTS